MLTIYFVHGRCSGDSLISWEQPAIEMDCAGGITPAAKGDRRSALARFVDLIVHSHAPPRTQTVDQVGGRLNVDKSYKPNLGRLLRKRLGLSAEPAQGKENRAPLAQAATWTVGQPLLRPAEAVAPGLGVRDFHTPCGTCHASKARRMYVLVMVFSCPSSGKRREVIKFFMT